MKKIGLEKIIFGGLLAALIALRLTAPSMTMEAQAATYGPNGKALKTLEIDGNDTVSSEKLAGRLERLDDDETMVVKTSSGIVWEFDGDRITDPKKEISSFKVDIKTTVDDSLKEAVGDSPAIVLDFANTEGELPGKARIRIPSDRLSGLGTTRDICVYYNDGGKLTEGQRGLVISGGYLEFTISHCSEYVIKIEEGSTKDDDDDDDDDHHETHTVASWVKNPNEKQ